MPFGGSIYQVLLALIIGVVWALRKQHADAEAAALGARASFVLGAIFMLFSGKAWWPAALSTLALATWALSGWIVARIGYFVTSWVRSFRTGA